MIRVSNLRQLTANSDLNWTNKEEVLMSKEGKVQRSRSLRAWMKGEKVLIDRTVVLQLDFLAWRNILMKTKLSPRCSGGSRLRRKIGIQVKILRNEFGWGGKIDTDFYNF